MDAETPLINLNGIVNFQNIYPLRRIGKKAVRKGHSLIESEGES